ncbi:MAG: iron-containing alcohol dehydrogenase [Victivallaceae bacterium]
MKYSLQFPGKIIFGAGTYSLLPEYLPFDTRILLVTGRHAEHSGLVDGMFSLLKGHEVISSSSIAPEPSLQEVDNLLKAGRYNEVNAVVAIGGGSVIDCGKTAAALIPCRGKTADFFYGKKSVPGKGLFFAALPTTAGTGAEITPNAVLTDQKTDIKKSIRHDTMFADVAIIDPELTYSCPPELTAASGIDALTQAIESYIARDANPVSMTLAAKATALLFANLKKAYLDPNNFVARSAMAEGSMIGAMAFTQSGLGAVHGLAHPIGSKLHVPHGMCCAILLPIIMKSNLPHCEKQMNELAVTCGCGNAGQFIEEIKNLCAELNVPAGFSSFGFNRSYFQFILDNCRSNSMKKNPRTFTDAEIEQILEKLL